MRRLLVGLVVAAATALVPVWALAGNQEVAEQIAARLRQSGQLQSYKIGVKYQDGTAWLRGQVSSREQMNTALRLVSETPGVNRVVNDLTIGPGEEEVSRAAAPSPVQPVVAMSTAPQSANQAGPMLIATSAAPPAGQPIPIAYSQIGGASAAPAAPAPQYVAPMGAAVPAQYDQPNVPNYAWPSYAPYPNYAALTYPKQYSATAWPYIGPFYPYPQVPLGWRKVTLEWHDGWWRLDFDDGPRKGYISNLFRPCSR